MDREVFEGIVSYFRLRTNVARSRAENSCSTGQNRCRLAEIAAILYQLRRAGSVQVFSAWAERFCSGGSAREAGVRRNSCRDAASKPRPFA